MSAPIGDFEPRDYDPEMSVEEAQQLLRCPPPVRLYSPDVKPEPPSFAVRGLILRRGFHFIWAQPSGGKTYTTLTLVHQMMLARRILTRGGDHYLFDHDALQIEHGWERVLFVSTEETAGRLRWRAEKVRRGLGAEAEDFAIEHVFTARHGKGLSLLDVPRYLADHGPYDAVILDSLTGLRPREIEGKQVKWDVDNDATNLLTLAIRSMVETYDLPVILLHHTGREVGKGYRGPTDWWASADVQLGLVPEETTAGLRWRVKVEKVRDGQKPKDFLLKPDWPTEDSFILTYDGEAKAALPDSQLAILAYFQTNAGASAADAIRDLPLHQNTIRQGIKALEGRKRLTPLGLGEGRSPRYAAAEGDADA